MATESVTTPSERVFPAGFNVKHATHAIGAIGRLLAELGDCPEAATPKTLADLGELVQDLAANLAIRQPWHPLVVTGDVSLVNAKAAALNEIARLSAIREDGGDLYGIEEARKLASAITAASAITGAAA